MFLCTFAHINFKRLFIRTEKSRYEIKGTLFEIALKHSLPPASWKVSGQSSKVQDLLKFHLCL